jgi:hypothetical protein
VTALPGVNTELAAAIRRVNALYARCPEPRPDVDGSRWRELEAEIDHHTAVGDRDGALHAIREWEAHARRVLGGLR